MTVSPERILELLAPFLESRELSPPQITSVKIYLDLLIKWNATISLTAIRDPEEIVTRHFGESLFAARHLLAHTVEDVADLGTGAGFPGIPLKIWDSSIRLALIESNHRKAVFLRETIRALRLTDVAVENIRADQIPGRYNLVTLRAVETFEAVLPVAGSLVRAKGRLALLIGETQVAHAKATLLNLSWQEPIAIPLSRNRCLLVAQVS